MKRAGTKQAELLSKKWPLIRKATAKGQNAGLILCRYVEYVKKELHGEYFLSTTHQEEIDCLLYEVDPKTVDVEKYHEADKLIGFPWCDISHDPLINAFFEEIQSGNRWIITGILSDDPIKAFTQCACTRWYDTTQTAVPVSVYIYSGSAIKINAFEDDKVFWSKTTSGATAQALTDSYVEVQQTVLGPKLADLASRVGQRARFVYSASIQATATGASGGQVKFKVQRSMELDEEPEVWADIADSIADVSLAAGQDGRITFSFTNTIPAGVDAGIALKYRLLAMRSDSDHGATLHSGDVSPTITIDGQFLYPESEDIESFVSITTGTTETVSASSIEAENTSVAVLNGATLAAVANAAEIEAASVDVTSGSTETIDVSSISVEDASVSIESGTVDAVSSYVAVASDVSVIDGASITVDVNSIEAEPLGVSIVDGASIAVTAYPSSEGSVEMETGASATVEANAEVIEESDVATTHGASLEFAIWVAENMYSAPPSDPDADELGLTYEEVLGTSVTIPAQDAGYPSVRFSYNAAISLLATGVSGGLCTFQLQQAIGAGVWTDVSGETATKEFASQNQEERFVFSLYAPFPSGINPSTQVRLRVVAKTDEAGKEVQVHSSLIDPNNTSPTVYAEAYYFFT